MSVVEDVVDARQKVTLSTSFLATARCIRKGSKTASVDAASAAVQDHDAAAFCVASSITGEDKVIFGIVDGACESFSTLR